MGISPLVHRSPLLNNLAVFLPNTYNVINGQTVHGSVVVPAAFVPSVNPVFAASIAPTPIITNVQAGLNNTLHTNEKTSFAPRIGFAWRPFGNDKTVIRGGYGKYIETILGILASAGCGVFPRATLACLRTRLSTDNRRCRCPIRSPRIWRSPARRVSSPLERSIIKILTFSSGISLWNGTLVSIPVCEFLMTATTAPIWDSG